MRLFFFGDGYNDEKMLIAAGLGLVMANAPEV
jgi:hydroxymethylpyrimidine pyrophosphatase-like HAD family hydrolase